MVEEIDCDRLFVVAEPEAVTSTAPAGKAKTFRVYDRSPTTSPSAPADS